MLIRFLAENFLSFKEETEFNMLTGDVRRFPDHVYSHPKIDLLKSAVIYGANGAGKSNLITAVESMVEMITHSSLDYFNYVPTFKLGELENKPSTLEIEFITEGIGYAYGIKFNKGIILEEWLKKLNYGKKDDETIFNRTTTKKGTTKIVVAPKYSKTIKDKMRIQVYEEEILNEDELFLSLATDKRYGEITAAYNYLAFRIFIINAEVGYSAIVSSFMEKPEFKEFTNKHISHFDTGVKSIDIETISFDLYFGQDNLAEKEHILKLIQNGSSQVVGDSKNAIAMMEDEKPVIKKMVSYHTNHSTGELVKFDLWDESDGTLRLLDFLPIIYMLENYPITIFIDEMDQSIHPALLKQFIAKLQENPNKIGQLIFTTHESNLLDLNIFRQDEIWFAEKDKKGATQFYPLSDYNIRPDLDVRKGYLSGRFGAIPFLADLKKLSWLHND